MIVLKGILLLCVLAINTPPALFDSCLNQGSYSYYYGYTYYYYYYTYCSYSCCGYTTYRYCCSSSSNSYSVTYETTYSSTGIIIGSAVGGLVFIFFIVLLIVCICKSANRGNAVHHIQPATQQHAHIAMVQYPQQPPPYYSQPPPYHPQSRMNQGYASAPEDPAFPPGHVFGHV